MHFIYFHLFSSSGPTASDIVSTTSRVLKKIDSVRLLESQMASLRQSYENWVDEEPEVESDRPTEEEMAEFEEAEKKHRQQFASLEQRASYFSQSLGVFGKLSDFKLVPALNGFVREGIRFSFSNLDSNGDDTLVLGSRLSFLLLLSKYSSWVKKNKQSKAKIQEYIDELEIEMRNHKEFEDVHEDDLEALDSFRKTIGLKPLPKFTPSVATQNQDGLDDDVVDDESMDSVSDLHATPTSSMRRSTGRPSSTSTTKSRASLNQSSLPPLPEAEEETPPNENSEDELETPRPLEDDMSDGNEPPPSTASSKFSHNSKRSQSQGSHSQATYSGDTEESVVSDQHNERLSNRSRKKSRSN